MGELSKKVGIHKVKRGRTYPVNCGDCMECKKPILAYSAGFVKPNRKFCSVSCKTTFTNKTDKNPSKRPEQRKETGERSKRLYTGKKKPKGFAERLREVNLGSKHWNWQGGKTSESRRIRNSSAYRHWRESVFDRDDYTCVLCGDRGGTLNADHIKPFAYFPELRLDINNGRTLCYGCHYKTDTFGAKCFKNR